MIDNIFDVVFRGKGSVFKNKALLDYSDSKVKYKKKKLNLGFKKQSTSVLKRSIEIYAELLRFSLKKLNKLTLRFLKGDLLKIFLYKAFKNFSLLKIRYISFFKSFSDFILVRCLLFHLFSNY